MTIFADETVKDGSITASSSSVNYPAANVFDSRLSRVYRSSSATTITLVFDALSAVDVSGIAIANHNISASVTVLKLEGNATDSWGAPSYTNTLTWDDDIIIENFTAETYRYWRISVTDTTNSDGYIEIGRAWLGDVLVSPDISPSVTDTYNSASQKAIAVSGQSYMDIRYRFKTISVQLPKVSFAEKVEIFDLLDTVDIGTPFFVNFEETNSDLGANYVTFDLDSLQATLLPDKAYYTISLSYREEK